jgi:arginase family enzyme
MERRVLVQGTMDPRLIIVGGIRAYDSAQMRFTEYDHVVQALPADRADEPLNVSVLPG